MAINWGMGGPQNNALAYFQLGSQIGAQAREAAEKRETRNALATVARRPSASTPTSVGPPPGGIVATPQQQAWTDDMQARTGNRVTDDGRDAAWQVLYRNEPELAMRIQERERRDVQASQEQRRADLPLIGRLLDNSTDEASYQQSRQIAGEYGIDVSQLPPNFDAAWVDQQRKTIKMLSDPKAQEALSTAGKIAVDMGLKPGTPEFNAKVGEIWIAGEAKPYVVGGETRLYTPKIGGAGQAVGSPSQDAIDALKRGEGTPEQFDEMFGAGAAARVMGGPAAAPQTPFAAAFPATDWITSP